MHGNQHFIYDINSNHILHVVTNLCLDCDLNSKLIYMTKCNSESKTQQWKFSSYNRKLILKHMKEFFLKN